MDVVDIFGKRILSYSRIVALEKHSVMRAVAVDYFDRQAAVRIILCDF
jgi:hypothetical protein